MNCQDQHNDQQSAHHYLGDFLNTILQSHEADDKAYYTDNHHPQDHGRCISHHIGKSPCNSLGIRSHKISPQAFEAVIQHPSAYGSVKHHQHIATDNAYVFQRFPAGSLRCQPVKAFCNTDMASTTYSEL